MPPCAGTRTGFASLRIPEPERDSGAGCRLRIFPNDAEQRGRSVSNFRLGSQSIRVVVSGLGGMNPAP